MPNIIINNYCNISCSYCFASANMKNNNMQKTMSLKTYMKILKYLKINQDNDLRILGGEPLVHPKFKRMLNIGYDLGFDIIVFSNITIDNKIFKELFGGISGIRINCNINNMQFYTETQKRNIESNLELMKKQGIYPILGYNIMKLDSGIDYIFELGNKYNIKDINLKITNSSLGSKLLIDNKDTKLGEYLYNIIEKYYKDYFFEVSCGLDKSVFTQDQLSFFESIGIGFSYGCSGNIGKFDINTDGSIFKCFPLVSLYADRYNIDYMIDNNISIKDCIDLMYKDFGVLPSTGECIANSIIKSQK